MDTASVLFLGILQGLTEFLPVSSSGHLVLAEKLLPNFGSDSIFLEVFLHAGTMLAILIYFRRRILALTRKDIYLLLIGSIPAGVFGLLFREIVENFFRSLLLVAFGFLLTSLFNFLTDILQDKQNKAITSPQAFLIGLFQAIAIVPGISRSGATIFGAVLQGVDRSQAAFFSFLLSIPAVAGAVTLEVVSSSLPWHFSLQFFLPYLLGFLVAFASGMLALKIVMKILLQGQFKLFAFYCFLLGLTLLFFQA